MQMGRFRQTLNQEQRQESQLSVWQPVLREIPLPRRGSSAVIVHSIVLSLRGAVAFVAWEQNGQSMEKKCPGSVFFPDDDEEATKKSAARGIALAWAGPAWHV